MPSLQKALYRGNTNVYGGLWKHFSNTLPRDFDIEENFSQLEKFRKTVERQLVTKSPIKSEGSEIKKDAGESLGLAFKSLNDSGCDEYKDEFKKPCNQAEKMLKHKGRKPKSLPWVYNVFVCRLLEAEHIGVIEFSTEKENLEDLLASTVNQSRRTGERPQGRAPCHSPRYIVNISNF